jgi:hypothetical protein
VCAPAALSPARHVERMPARGSAEQGIAFCLAVSTWLVICSWRMSSRYEYEGEHSADLRKIHPTGNWRDPRQLPYYTRTTTTMSTTPATPNTTNPEPLSFGVGARITVSVMSDRYVEIILGALRQVDPANLVVETGDVSTYIGGAEVDILRYLIDLCLHIASSGAHSSIAVHLFRGCPGAVTCDLSTPRSVDIPRAHTGGRWAAAEWTLYPLTDVPGSDHMRDIYAAIDYAKQNGTYVKADKSVTRLEGKLGILLETAMAGWIQVGRSVQHVVSHLSISINSPSHTSQS